jgi:CheY-specific phosphatase CheX
MLDFVNCERCKNIEVIKPFVETTFKLLKEDFSITPTSVEIIRLEQSVDINNINFISTLTGAVDTNLIFSFDKGLAKNVLDNFPYIEYDDDTFEELILETVSEFLNFVIGRAMKDIKSPGGLRFTTPIALSGDNRYYLGKKFEVCEIKVSASSGSMIMIFATKKDEEK